jgi:hypothetical protein
MTYKIPALQIELKKFRKLLRETKKAINKLNA